MAEDTGDTEDTGGTEGLAVAEGIAFPDTGDGRTWVVGAVVTDGRGRVFVQRRSPDRRLFPGCWDLVGGHVEPGETMAEAMRREIAEETGWRLAGVLAELHRLVWTPDDGVPRHEVDYLVSVDGDLAAPRLEPGKHTEAAWITEDDLDLLHDARDPGDTFVADVAALGLAKAHALLAAPPPGLN
ncbi:NUDIX domain-containing protein [Streptomonospora nanhaiensis]|uniref:NUDIX domain-containing protein n=1 Tax=Streptomonospora nanhaiensis TaxID=1323731 RepID=UPI001C99EE42|nr:NUDIX domain-containing protein [Streptomonospora nanhaiensis]MBX9390529.1 NUDIX domain-containing protein [Streptomonospora nanhaiensis]